MQVCPEEYAAMFRGKVQLPPQRDAEFDGEFIHKMMCFFHI